jgi:peptidoglycan hydrolase-like protein with peptidoglycan-binding domain
MITFRSVSRAAVVVLIGVASLAVAHHGVPNLSPAIAATQLLPEPVAVAENAMNRPPGRLIAESWRRERIAMSAPQADVQVTLSLPILRRGQHAGEPPVERLQFMLNFVAGVDNLDVDGIFGPRTEAAVRGFQQNENLSVDGIVGRQTWTALLRHWLLFSQPG